MGKTTVGRKLAGRLGVPFHDVDRMVEEIAGESVAEIWATSGESRFRELELAAVAELGEVHAGVVALGAGALSTPDVLAVLRGQDKVVELWADIPELVDRLGDVSERPALSDGGAPLVRRLEEMGEIRAGLYREVASVRIDTTAKSPDCVCTLIVEELGL